MTRKADAADAQTAPNTQKGRGFFATLAKYGGVSFTQTFVELGVFALLSAVLPHGVANATAVVCSAAYQFLMNRNLTFKSTSSFSRSVVLFALLWLWNLGFSSAALAWAPDALEASPLVVKLITMGCQGVWGFLLSRYVIFK